MSNETAGEHYTPRELNPAATVEMSGQELNSETWAIACSELMMRGVAPELMAPGNSLVDDAFRGTRFDYVLANPPYGVDSKAYAEPIKAEALTAGGSNRFHAGLPRISDGSLLFLQHMISKMKPASAASAGSRLAIVLSGSPLFSGGAGSGESEVRRWIIENDLLEGIVGLPDQMFYNTGISTYVWIVTNRKPAERVGIVTLVDARGLGTKMRKSLGDKRKELTRDAIDEIARLFRDAVELDGSDARVKVMRNQDFGFARLTVERPMRRTWRVEETTTAALAPELASAVASLLGKTWPDEKQARVAVSACGLQTRQINTVLKSIAVYDAEADPIRAKKGGGYEADADLRDQENIPLADGYLSLSPAQQANAVREAAEKHLTDEICHCLRWRRSGGLLTYSTTRSPASTTSSPPASINWRLRMGCG